MLVGCKGLNEKRCILLKLGEKGCKEGLLIPGNMHLA